MAHYALPHLKSTAGSHYQHQFRIQRSPAKAGTSGYVGFKGRDPPMTREWAVELLPYGIRVMPSFPAKFMTPPISKGWHVLQSAEKWETYRRQYSIGKANAPPPRNRCYIRISHLL